MGSPPSAAHTTPWPRPRRSRGLWPEARSSEGAAPRSRPCRTGTAAPALKHSDDPPHAPWFASATPGPSVYPQPQPSGIPADPFSRSPYDAADRATLDKAQQHSILVGAQQPVAGQSLGLGIVLGPCFGVQPQRLAPGAQGRLRQAAPPGLVGMAPPPGGVATRQADQAVAPVFLSAYCGSGRVIQVLARRQPSPSRLSASRTVSRLTRSAVIPCSAQTSAARARVQVERALPNCRGLWGKSVFSRSLRWASKSLAAVCGRRDCMATTASPRGSNARRTLRTACGLHPTAWAIMGAVSPRAEAKRMGQRRTLNPSDERRPARKAWRSRSLNSRTKSGFIPQQMLHGLHTNNVR